jgi:DNA-binding CsgD family transcriptional regulator
MKRQQASIGTGEDLDFRRWMRDMGALLALPSLWVDHEPAEIATGLLSILSGILRLEAAYARFDEPGAGRPLEMWRPSGPTVPEDFVTTLSVESSVASGIWTADVARRGGMLRVTTLPLELPWETGLVMVSAARADFPTEMETHLLRVAVSQAAIAIHTARRLARERAARAATEEALAEQNRLLRSLFDDLGPLLSSASHRVGEASRTAEQLAAGGQAAASASNLAESVSRPATGPIPISVPLTRREIEVLGLLAQGLSNKEMAGVMWLSDRTVERHITSLYRKIGVGRRSEATAFALRHGVV